MRLTGSWYKNTWPSQFLKNDFTEALRSEITNQVSDIMKTQSATLPVVKPKIAKISFFLCSILQSLRRKLKEQERKRKDVEVSAYQYNNIPIERQTLSYNY